MIEPRLDLAITVVCPGRRAVVATDDEQVGAVRAQCLKSLKRAALLDVEEAVEHQDRQAGGVAAEGAPPPPLIEHLVL